MNGYEVLAAPFDGLDDGRLVIRRGLGNAILVGDETMAELYTVRCTGRAPRARCGGGVVELTFPLIAAGARTRADISLNAAVPWEIEVAGGASDLQADLVLLRVRSIDISGGIVRTILELPMPGGTLPIRLGAASDTTIRRPPGVPVRVQVRRDARRVTLDDQHVDASGGPMTFTTPGFDGAADRVDVSVDSAADVAITTTDLTRDVPTGPMDVMAAAHTWLARMPASGAAWTTRDMS